MTKDAVYHSVHLRFTVEDINKLGCMPTNKMSLHNLKYPVTLSSTPSNIKITVRKLLIN